VLRFRRFYPNLSAAFMSKSKSIFVCQSCGAIAARWTGKCPECGEWNSIVEEAVINTGRSGKAGSRRKVDPIPVTAPVEQPAAHISTGLAECDRVLGGGIVPGSLVLVGGDPGIGKSTLMLQVGHYIAAQGGKVLYVSGEESFAQTRLRATRLNALDDRLLLLTETNMDAVAKQINSNEYDCVIVDSIQSMYDSDLSSVPGSLGQVRECANVFLRIAKDSGVPIFLVGHVTKDGSIAGPRVLEHLVDTVLYFEGEGKQTLRILRGVKNRFGSTHEIGVFEMTGTGLVEVANPSALFLSERPEGISGSVVIPSVEGTRPMLVEVQALVTESHLASPRRTVTGVNQNRISLILAVLEKRADLPFSDKDIFVNVAGGVRLEEPAADLAIALALVSSLRDIPMEEGMAVFGEIGLAGEIRAVDMARQRLQEASKFGFEKCILPAGCLADTDATPVVSLSASNILEALEQGLSQ
jgi:DNA repair protein RadA/Sms